MPQRAGPDRRVRGRASGRRSGKPPGVDRSRSRAAMRLPGGRAPAVRPGTPRDRPGPSARRLAGARPLRSLPDGRPAGTRGTRGIDRRRTSGQGEVEANRGPASVELQRSTEGLHVVVLAEPELAPADPARAGRSRLRCRGPLVDRLACEPVCASPKFPIRRWTLESPSFGPQSRGVELERARRRPCAPAAAGDAEVLERPRAV